MIGFDPIGRSAIGEVAGGDDVIVFAPPAIAVSGAAGEAPSIHCGGSALPPGSAVTIAVVAPLVAGGRVLVVPAVSASVTSAAPLVSISATVTAPANDIGVSAAPPTVLAGSNLAPDAAAIAVDVVAPFIKAGDEVTINAPPATVTAASAPAGILVGKYIEASNTVTMITPYGEIGSASIGEFAIGEGEPSTRIVKRGIIVRVDGSPPEIFAGKSVFAPPRVVAVNSLPAEIDSRLRRIRVYAIAS